MSEEKEYRMVREGIVIKLIVDEDPFPESEGWDYFTGIPLEWWNTNITWLKEVREEKENE